MKKLLVVDDEEAMRRLLRLNLSDNYEIVETGEPEHALAIALEQKPDTILLDLRMPKYSGYELCQTFTTFSGTQLIPVVVISGEGGSKTKDFCKSLGVAAYFEKPVDFDALNKRLEEILTTGRKERRSEIRVRLRVPLKLRGRKSDGTPFEVLTMTENVSLSGFLCACDISLKTETIVEVFLVGSDEPAGTARIVRSEGPDSKFPRYGCRFVQKTGAWVLQ